MRIVLATVTSLALVSALPASGAAQEPVEAGTTAGVQRAPDTQTRAHEPRHGPSFLHVLAYGAGGSVLGGWTGFMTSQVIWSDWLGQRKPDLGKRRMQFTVSGAALGSLLGTLVGFHGELGSTVPAPPGLFVRPGSITAEEIRASAAHDAEEAIRLLRPYWLNRQRGNDLVRIDVVSMDSTLQGKVPPFEPEGIRVYLDDALLGGLQELNRFPLGQIARIEWWDARAATLRWGAGHSHGAIRIVTSASES
jgi:hypothetical protein